ncbi:hypothetical protein [Natrinema caseinilyticum]|uniref:hypothetical protein n=1 Tax=Natrinema caseinilyticum TaxID=2961570 RepID=UPI0020C1E8A2|nr:hypothetical protein [Natrinema caseinilyticum]
MAEDSESPSVSTTPAIYGLVAGLLHAGVAALLWDYFRYGVLWDVSFTGVYITAGIFALGFVPVLSSTRQKSISPVLLVSILLLASVYSEWQGYFSPRFGGPGPFGWYILLWVGVVLLAGLAGDLEVTLKQREAT